MSCQVEGDHLPNRILGHSATLVGHVIYVLHKSSRAKLPNRVLSVSILDTARRIWETYRLKGPKSCVGHVSFLIQDRLFLYGGRRDDKIFSHLWGFDTVCMEWHKCVTRGFIPTEWKEYSGHYLECCHALILICGRIVDKVVNRVAVLDMDSMTWASPEIKGTAPLERTHHCSCVYYDRIFVFGGVGPTKRYLNDLHVLNTEGVMMWSQPRLRGNHIPAPRKAMTMASCFGKLFVYGGLAQQQVTSSLDIFDIFNNQWSKTDWLGVNDEEGSADHYTIRGIRLRSASNVMVNDSNRLMIIGGEVDRPDTHYMIDAFEAE